MLALSVLLVAAGITAFRGDRRGAAGTGPLQPEASLIGRMMDRSLKLGERLVYPYSVVPGGVATAEEVVEAARRDPVVARHYAGFDPRRARVVTLRQPRLAYVSYRIKDRIYFTKQKVRLHEGEQVITDGKVTLRGRCGNKVEDEPQMQVSAQEPPESVLNSPGLTAPAPGQENALAAPGLTPQIEAGETPLAAVVTPPGFAPLGVPPTGPAGAYLTPPPPFGGVIGGGIPGPGAVTPGGPGTTPPSTPTTPPVEPGPAPPVPPPVVPPVQPPAAPPVNPPEGPPPVSPPPAAPPPLAPPATPPVTPPATPPSSGGPPGEIPPPALPPGPVPPPVLPPPGGTLPPPEIVIPPPPGANPPPETPEPPPVPEPSTYLLAGLGLAALAWARKNQA